MSDSGKAFWLGLFIIIALALVAWLILFLKPSVGDGRVTLTVRFSNIDKISKGTLVTFGGKQVGEVIKIREIPNPREAPADAFGNLYIYELKLKVDSSVQVYTYDEIIFATSGLLGEKSIAIIPRAPPPGALAARNVTGETLFARSTDKFEETLHTLTNVAGSFSDALEEVSIFIETNNQNFNQALKSLSSAGNEIHTFLKKANETDILKRFATATDNVKIAMVKADDFFTSAQENFIIERLGSSFDSLHEAACLFSGGNGTIAQLVNSDCFYVQLNSLLCQVKSILYDINTYGLLYQFDRKWQRANNLKRCCTEIPPLDYCQQ
jgi:phospholipid/cholesterol/gamma-HCH transport system substrate-binding protein